MSARAKSTGKKPKGAADWPRTVEFGNGRVRITKRRDGRFALRWREMGSMRLTTLATEARAMEFAMAKARSLDAGGSELVVARGEAEALAELKMAVGDDLAELRRLVTAVREAVKWLDWRVEELPRAARWYAEHGPLRVERTTLGEAAARWLREYDGSEKSRETYRTFAQEINGFLEADGKHRMMRPADLTTEMLEGWTRREVIGAGDQKQAPAPRTLKGRITTWVTFLNRCREWRYLPDGRHAADVIRKPSLPDAGRDIFTVDQGRRLLAAVREHEPKLEGYLIVAGWLGLRPSEIQRLTWAGFDWERKYLHVTALVAGKTMSERYVPMDDRVSARLHAIFLASGGKPAANVAIYRSREYLSLLARKHGICDTWPSDVLRHSFCSYRIAVVRSLPQVAIEAGNSPKMLEKHYRRPLRNEDGEAWWTLI